MQTGQQILTIAALVMLSLLTLGAFRIATNNQATSFESELAARAIHIGQCFIAEARTKYFDAACANGPIGSTDQLTSVAGLGHLYNENYPNFNDIDDYNGFDETITDEGASITIEENAGFRIEIDVFYVDKSKSSYPNKVYYKTFQKRLMVTVSNTELPRPIVLNQIFTYY